jgi:hypothetical protein
VVVGYQPEFACVDVLVEQRDEVDDDPPHHCNSDCQTIPKPGHPARHMHARFMQRVLMPSAARQQRGRADHHPNSNALRTHATPLMFVPRLNAGNFVCNSYKLTHFSY